MKQLYIAIALMGFLATGANAQITTPRAASPAAMAQQTVGISTVTIHYSRPAVREREVWGNIVKYGWNVQGFGAGNEAPWRSGANENTTITLSHDATIEGKAVKAGTYGLFYVINEDNTGEVVLNTDNRAWGSYWYTADNDVMRAPITIQENEHTERLTYDFINLDRTSATLILDWEQKRFPVSISFDVDAIVLNNARAELTGPTGFNWQGYFSGAQYLFNAKKEMDQALVWANLAAQQNPAFNTLNLKSNIEASMGDEKASKASKEQAMAVANEAQLNAYGYQLLNQKKFEEALKVMKENTKRFPKSANAWDSLGEAHVMAGKKKEAIAHFEKALNLDPSDAVRSNSEKYLKDLKN